MNEFQPFPELQMDVLKEVGNIGAAHAATALSMLVSKPIDMRVPTVRTIVFEEIADIVGGAEQIVVAIFLRVEGETPGNMFFILTRESAKRLLINFVGLEPDPGDSFHDMELSALHEIGNIMAGSYLSSLCDFTGLQMVPSVPSLAIDMAGALLSFGLLQSVAMGDHALLIDTKFLEGMDAVEGYFILIPDPGSFNKIFAALGVPSP